MKGDTTTACFDRRPHKKHVQPPPLTGPCPLAVSRDFKHPCLRTPISLSAPIRLTPLSSAPPLLLSAFLKHCNSCSLRFPIQCLIRRLQFRTPTMRILPKRGCVELQERVLVRRTLQNPTNRLSFNPRLGGRSFANTRSRCLGVDRRYRLRYRTDRCRDSVATRRQAPQGSGALSIEAASTPKYRARRMSTGPKPEAKQTLASKEAPHNIRACSNKQTPVVETRLEKWIWTLEL